MHVDWNHDRGQVSFDFSFNPSIKRKQVFDLASCRFIREQRDLLQDDMLNGDDQMMKRYLKPDLLIIDDMGLKTFSSNSGEYLFEIIMRRYENRSTIMTSNRPIKEWGKLIGDIPSATAILDRFLHHAEVINITGKSYRLGQRAARETPIDSKGKK